MRSLEQQQQNPKKLKLYSTWVSSCSWRVRIALNLKGLEFEYEGINLVNRDSPEFMKLSPLGYVPVLVDNDIVIADSTAIIQYLEDKYPQHSLLPQPDNLQNRAINYQVANMVAANIQPFQNLSVINYIEDKLGSDEKIAWIKHHLKKGFVALEKLLKDHAGTYATGDKVGLADLYLAPQIHGAINRFNIDINEFPLLKRLNDSYSEVSAIQDAAPDNQPDAPNKVK